MGMSPREGRPIDVSERAAGAASSGQRASGGAASSATPGGPPRSRLGGARRQGSGRQRMGSQDPQGEADSVPDHAEHEELARQRSPLYVAQHAQRYERQQLIRDYQNDFGCRLVVMIDQIFAYSIQYFEELLFDASSAHPLHLLLWSPGGDGEAAVRLVRSAQARCSELTVLVPDIAKSAATLFALGADKIVMGPASDLGPVDPQYRMGEFDLVSAKDIIAAVERALDDVAARPDTYALHSALLADVNALRVQQARSALDRTDDLVREALLSNPRRSQQEVEGLAKRLHTPLIEAPKDHAAIFSADDAAKHGLPVISCDPSSDQWRQIWQLWMRYYALFPAAIYESDLASQVLQRPADFG